MAVFAFVVDVCALPVAVEDHDEFGGVVDGADSVGCHRGELGGFAGLDDDVSIAEQELPRPVVTKIGPRS